MESFLYVLHIVLSFVIVIVVLLQSGKGGGLGAGFSNAAAVGQEVFGGRGAASFLGKLTWVLGFTFMATSMGLAWYSSQPQSALDLDMQADDPVEQVVHTVVDEGGSTPEMPDEIPEEMMQQMQQQMDGTEGVQDLEEGELPFDYDFDPDDADLSDQMQQQLLQELQDTQDELGVDPDEAPAPPIEGGIDDDADIEETGDTDEATPAAQEPEAADQDSAPAPDQPEDNDE